MNKVSLAKKMVQRNLTHVRNVAYFFCTRALSIAAFVMVVPFFIRNTSENQYGLAAIGFSLLSLGTVLDAAFGYVLTQILGRRYARGKEICIDRIDGLFSFYIMLACVLALCGFSVLTIVNLSLPEILLYGSFIALLPALSVSGVVAAVFQSRNQLKPINLSRFGFELAKALALGLSALWAGDIALIGPLLLVAAYARSILDMHYLAELTGIRLRIKGFSGSRRYWRLARHGTPSLYIVVLTALVTIGDKLLIKRTFGADAVAQYSVAFDVNTKAYLIINAVNTAMFAVVLHRAARKDRSFKPLAAGLATVSLVAILYYLPLLTITSFILEHWINKDFATNAAPLTQIMVCASLFYLYGNVFENALTAMGQARKVLTVYIVAVAAYGVAVSMAIWQENLNGFMYGYLILCIVLCAGFLIQYRQITRSTVIIGGMHAQARS